jgi:hypothetical protein
MVKWLFTALGLSALLILKNYYLWQGRIRTAVVLFILPLLYLVLVSYELHLFMNV